MDSRSKLCPTLVAVLSLTAVVALASPATCFAAASPLPAREPRLSIASPAPGTLVGGLIPVTVAFDAGRFGKITRLELWVNDLFYSTAPVEGAPARGTYALDLDTHRLRNGQHTLQVRAFSGNRRVATDAAVVTVSNGGADIVPPLVSFFAPLDGETISGTTTIGVNATDNDQVALVGISINRMPVLIKSNPPFTYQLDTTTLPLSEGAGFITLEAMAIDRSNNIGKAKPIRVRVSNPVNATPMQPDPADAARAASPASGKSAPAAPGESKPPVVGKEPKPAAVATPPKPATPASRPLTAPMHVAVLPKPAAPAPAEPAAPVAKPTPVTSARPMVPAASATPPVTRAPSSAVPARRLVVEPRPVATGEAPSHLAPSLAGPRPTPPSARNAGEPVTRPSRSAAATTPVGPPTPRAAADADARPTLMARAITPAFGATAPSAPATAPQPVAPAATPVSAAQESTLSDARPSAPPVVQQTPPATSPAPAKSPPRLSALPKPEALPAPPPAMEGGRLTLPVYVARPVPDSPSRSRSHMVKRGESLQQIARRYRVTPRSILVASGLESPSALRPGRRLTIPGTFDIVVDNRRIEFDVNPRVENGLPIAPFRQIFEQTGGVVVYYPGDRSVKAARPDREVRLKIGSPEAWVNGAVVLMERPATIDSGRTMVPVRFVTEALDMVAEYDVKTGNLYLIRK